MVKYNNMEKMTRNSTSNWPIQGEQAKNGYTASSLLNISISFVICIKTYNLNCYGELNYNQTDFYKFKKIKRGRFYEKNYYYT